MLTLCTRGWQSNVISFLTDCTISKLIVLIIINRNPHTSTSGSRYGKWSSAITAPMDSNTEMSTGINWARLGGVAGVLTLFFDPETTKFWAIRSRNPSMTPPWPGAGIPDTTGNGWDANVSTVSSRRPSLSCNVACKCQWCSHEFRQQDGKFAFYLHT